MEKLTPKNVYIIKLRKYASPYYLKLWHEKNSNIGYQKHLEAAKKYHEFFIKLYEFVTKSHYNNLFNTYGGSMSDCAKEILHNDYQILQFEGEAYTTFVFNKNNSELISFFTENITNIPHKIMKRSRYWMHYNQPPSNYFRETFKLSPEEKKQLFKSKNI